MLKPLTRATARLALPIVAVVFGCGLASAADSAQPLAKVRVAAVQFVSRWAKPAENRKAIEPLGAGGGQERGQNRRPARNRHHRLHEPRHSPDLANRRRQGEPGLQGVSPKEFAETVPGESTRESSETWPRSWAST